MGVISCSVSDAAYAALATRSAVSGDDLPEVVDLSDIPQARDIWERPAGRNSDSVKSQYPILPGMSAAFFTGQRACSPMELRAGVGGSDRRIHRPKKRAEIEASGSGTPAAAARSDLIIFLRQGNLEGSYQSLTWLEHVRGLIGEARKGDLQALKTLELLASEDERLLLDPTASDERGIVRHGGMCVLPLIILVSGGIDGALDALIRAANTGSYAALFYGLACGSPLFTRTDPYPQEALARAKRAMLEMDVTIWQSLASTNSSCTGAAALELLEKGGNPHAHAALVKAAVAGGPSAGFAVLRLCTDAELISIIAGTPPDLGFLSFCDLVASRRDIVEAVDAIAKMSTLFSARVQNSLRCLAGNRSEKVTARVKARAEAALRDISAITEPKIFTSPPRTGDLSGEELERRLGIRQGTPVSRITYDLPSTLGRRPK